MKQHSILGLMAMAAGLVVAACSGDDNNAANCPAGTANCPCAANATCSAGLTCSNNVCVSATAQGTGGSATTPGATGGSGGVPASGGTVGTGGATETGGATATGGTPGTGGAAETGGAPGTGGASCSDTTSDAKNCGVCGHECKSGTCTGGKCVAGFATCIKKSEGSSSCAAYCTSVGASCVTRGCMDVTYLTFTIESDCVNKISISSNSNASCDTSIDWSTGGYVRCCCADK